MRFATGLLLVFFFSGVLITIRLSVFAQNRETTTPRDLPFSFTKPKAKKEAPDSVKKKAEKMDFAQMKKEKLKKDSIKMAKSVISQLAIKYPGMPRNAAFCGEKIPVEMPTVAEKFNGIFQRYAGAKGLIGYYLGISNRYKKDFQSAMRRNGIPADLFYLVCAESGFANLTSSKGAKGFFQFMEETARDYGLEVSYTVDERLHPSKSADAASRYLKNLRSSLGSWTLAAAAYNMGIGAVEATASSQGTRSYYQMNLNPETGEYVYRILAIKILMENPKGYGIYRSGNYQPIPHIVEKVRYHIHDLKEYANDCNVDYATLKILNPWLISDKLWIKEGKTYEIILPKFSYQKISADERIPLPYVDPDGSLTTAQVRETIKMELNQ